MFSCFKTAGFYASLQTAENEPGGHEAETRKTEMEREKIIDEVRSQEMMGSRAL